MRLTRNQLYYQLKPCLPRRLRMALRRIIARRKLKDCQNVWPIDPAAGQAPSGWPGWPERKKFALVLTHDVEGPAGLAKCLKLMELEQELGFRSAFNFVPEGQYRVSRELRGELARNGFEVGVHDLNHDGKLYRTHREFREKAQRINHYIAEWGASGFRSAFMMHNLEWLQELNIQYDASTFDTDPFEPQPDAAGTIFPFWVAGQNGRGYVEMPYSLPQDSTLFCVLKEKTPDIWIKKLEWIARRGGMALVNVHPDYVRFDDGVGPDYLEFSSARYRDFLEWVKLRHAGDYWHALPREVAKWVRTPKSAARAQPTGQPVNGFEAGAFSPQLIWLETGKAERMPIDRT